MGVVHLNRLDIKHTQKKKMKFFQFLLVLALICISGTYARAGNTKNLPPVTQNFDEVMAELRGMGYSDYQEPCTSRECHDKGWAFSTPYKRWNTGHRLRKGGKKYWFDYLW